MRSLASKKMWYVVVAICAVAIVLFMYRNGKEASAQDGPRIQLPAAPTITENGVTRVRPVGTSAVTITQEGVVLGPNGTTGLPGSATQPVPTFSAINAPYWFTDNGRSLQMVNDVILYGLADVKMGLTNTGMNGTNNLPVTIYDNVAMPGGGVEQPGNVTVSGATTSRTLTLGQTANAGSLNVVGALTSGRTQLTGELRVLTGTVTAQSATFTGPVTVGGNTGTGVLNVQGTITAEAIGRFYKRSSPPTTLRQSNPNVEAVVSCDSEDVLLACIAQFRRDSNGVMWSSTTNAATCTAEASLAPNASSEVIFEALASCFSPNG